MNDNAFYNKHSDQIDRNDDGLSGQYSEKSKRMMSNMGFKPGKGLGKFEHGRLEPVATSKQKGKRGLGFQASVVGSAPKDFKWSPNSSVPVAVEEVVNEQNFIPNVNILSLIEYVFKIACNLRCGCHRHHQNHPLVLF